MVYYYNIRTTFKFKHMICEYNDDSSVIISHLMYSHYSVLRMCPNKKMELKNGVKNVSEAL